MKKLILIFFACSMLLASCTNNTKQIKLVNDQASLPPVFNFDRLGLKVMASSVNKKQNTMSTLYANTIALKNAMQGLKETTPGGVMALITWKRKTDGHWFGANIPGELQSIELLKATGKLLSYERYQGKTLTAIPDTSNKEERINYILSCKRSIMP